MPAVSVIIPTWNRAASLREAVGSVASQDFTDREIIVVDDGSTDDTPSVARALGDAIRYVRQENRGPGAARNHGIRLARGRYIAFLDSDDLFLPGKLAAQVACFEERPEIGLVYTACMVLEDGREARRYEADLFGWVYPEVVMGCNLPTPSVMVRADVLAAVGGFSENLRWAEDLDLWRRVARRYPVAALKDPFTVVRRHSGNRRPDPVPITDDVIAFAESARVQNPELDERSCRRAAAGLYLHYARCTLEYARQMSGDEGAWRRRARMLARRAATPAALWTFLDACQPNAVACVSPLTWAGRLLAAARPAAVAAWRGPALRCMLWAMSPEAAWRSRPLSGTRGIGRWASCARLAVPVARTLDSARRSGARRLAVLGLSEAAAMTIIGARGRRLEVVEVFDDAHVGATYFGLPIKATSEMRNCWADHIVIAGAVFDAACRARWMPALDDAVERLSHSVLWKSRLLWPLGGIPVAMTPTQRERLFRATGVRPAEADPEGK